MRYGYDTFRFQRFLPHHFFGRSTGGSVVFIFIALGVRGKGQQWCYYQSSLFERANPSVWKAQGCPALFLQWV